MGYMMLYIIYYIKPSLVAMSHAELMTATHEGVTMAMVMMKMGLMMIMVVNVTMKMFNVMVMMKMTKRVIVMVRMMKSEDDEEC